MNEEPTDFYPVSKRNREEYTRCVQLALKAKEKLIQERVEKVTAGIFLQAVKDVDLENGKGFSHMTLFRNPEVHEIFVSLSTFFKNGGKKSRQTVGENQPQDPIPTSVTSGNLYYPSREKLRKIENQINLLVEQVKTLAEQVRVLKEELKKERDDLLKQNNNQILYIAKLQEEGKIPFGNGYSHKRKRVMG